MEGRAGVEPAQVPLREPFYIQPGVPMGPVPDDLNSRSQPHRGMALNCKIKPFGFQGRMVGLLVQINKPQGSLRIHGGLVIAHTLYIYIYDKWAVYSVPPWGVGEGHIPYGLVKHIVHLSTRARGSNRMRGCAGGTQS